MSARSVERAEDGRPLSAGRRVATNPRLTSTQGPIVRLGELSDSVRRRAASTLAAILATQVVADLLAAERDDPAEAQR